MPLLKATSMIGTLPGCAALSESERTGCTALSAGIAKAECMAARNTKGRLASQGVFATHAEVSRKQHFKTNEENHNVNMQP